VATAVGQSMSQVRALASSPRRTIARLSGIVLALTLVAILFEHGVPGATAGQRVSGTDNLSAIHDFYNHRSYLAVWWLGGVGIIGMVLFPLAFRAYLRTFELGPVASLFADLATAVMVVEAPLIAIELGLQSALVQVVSGGRDNGVMALFASWDWIYNGFTYWFEIAWMSTWAALAIRTRALPRWVAVLGAVTALGLLFNSAVLVLRLADNYTLIPTLFLVVWMFSTSVYLLRGGNQADAG
jgi:hypothetical protein